MRHLLIIALCCCIPVLMAADKEPSKKEVMERIKQAGETKPDWWDEAKLDYPATLKLDWPTGGGGWQPQVQPGAYFHSIVCPNRDKWQDGVKLLHYIIKLNEESGNKEAIPRAGMYLIRLYGPMLQDWERSAYWCLKLGLKDDVRLADCYYRMGARKMAASVLKQHRSDRTRHGTVIKLWADLGEYKTAYKLAADRVKSGEDIGYYMAGYTAQLEGAYDKALAFFEKAKNADKKKSGRDWKQTVRRAGEAIQAITLFETFTLKGVKDGTYTDSSHGYEAPVEVAVTIKDEAITDVKVVNHRESLYFSALEAIPQRIIEKQSVCEVDAVMSATITSEAILYATAKAVQQGRK